MTKAVLRLFVICHLIFGISEMAFADQNRGLFDCYRLSLKQSEQIGIYQERIEQARANFQQAFSGILPRVSYVAKELREDQSGSSPERKLFIEQPLFRGFKEFSAMARQKALREQRGYEKKRAEQLLFLDVSDAFYQILELQKDLKILAQTGQIAQKQIRETASWVRIGRSRPSELAAAKSGLKQIQAEIAKTRRLLALSREVMTFLAGVENLTLSEDQWEWDSQGIVSSFLEGVQTRPDVAAKENQELAAKENIKVERADLFPDVSLEGNSFQKRTGSKKNVDWDVLLTIDLPIFKGKEWGDIKESQSLYEQARLETELARRQAESEVRSAYRQFQISLVEQRALKEALSAERQNYELQKKDYEFRLISQTALLSSLRDLQEIQRQLNNVEFETKRQFWNLKVASGQVDQTP